VHYEFHTGNIDLDRVVAQARVTRLVVRLSEERARLLVGRAIAMRGDISGRDLAVLLDLSFQRVHQLIQRTGRTT